MATGRALGVPPGGRTCTESEKAGGAATHSDPALGEHADVQTDAHGRFRVEGLVPGQLYTARAYRGIGRYAGIAFENLVLGPGEIRDLGDIRTSPPVSVLGK